RIRARARLDAAACSNEGSSGGNARAITLTKMILRSGVIAAGLVVAAVVLVAGGRAAPSRGGVTHTCSATDRQFISVAELNISSIGMFGDDYLHGSAATKEVVGAARDASTQM